MSGILKDSKFSSSQTVGVGVIGKLTSDVANIERLNVGSLRIQGKRIRRGPEGPTGATGPAGTGVSSFGTATNGGLVTPPSETRGGTNALPLDQGVSSYGNTAFGAQAFLVLPDDSNNFGNIGMGYNAGSGLTLGNQNVLIGHEVASGFQIGAGNVFIGGGVASTMQFGDGNVSVGLNSLGGSLSFPTDNVALGKNSMQGANDPDNCVVIGVDAASVGISADNTIAIGNAALQNITSSPNNVCIGKFSGRDITNDGTGGNTSVGSGSFNAGTGSENSCFGVGSGAGITTGTQNCCFGSSSGAIMTVTSGSGNTMIGVGANVSGGSSNSIAIGSNSTSNASNKTTLGNGDTTVCDVYGIFGATTGGAASAVFVDSLSQLQTAPATISIGDSIGTTSSFLYGVFGVTVGLSGLPVVLDNTGQLGTAVSSIRFKREVKAVDEELTSKLHELRPVTFSWKKDTENTRQIGLIAEEVEEVLPGLVRYNQKGEIMGVAYQDLIPLLLKELQDQRVLIDSLDKQIQQLKL